MFSHAAVLVYGPADDPLSMGESVVCLSIAHEVVNRVPVVPNLAEPEPKWSEPSDRFPGDAVTPFLET